MSIKRRELIKLGYGPKELLPVAVEAAAAAAAGGIAKAVLRRRFRALIDHPEGFMQDPFLGELARLVTARQAVQSSPADTSRPEPNPHPIGVGVTTPTARPSSRWRTPAVCRSPPGPR